MSETKQIKDLTNIEIMEDIKYYLNYAQLQSPSFVDKTFDIIRKYTKELYERFKK